MKIVLALGNEMEMCKTAPLQDCSDKNCDILHSRDLMWKCLLITFLHKGFYFNVNVWRSYHVIFYLIDVLREAFQTKKWGNFGLGPKWKFPPPPALYILQYIGYDYIINIYQYSYLRY